MLVLTYSQLMFYFLLFIDLMDLYLGLFQISPLDVFCSVFSYVAAAMVLACKKIATLLFPLLFQHFLLYNLHFQTLSIQNFI